MSKEFKPQVYYLLRRGWYEQTAALCETLVQKKGKDPVAIFWKAFATGMCGNVQEALRLLEMFQSRRDLQFPVSLALLFFHRRNRQVVDHEAIETLRSELSIAEDVTKEAGLVLAARFCLFTNNLEEAQRICQKLLVGGGGGGSGGGLSAGAATTAFEAEALTIDCWCLLSEVQQVLRVESLDSLDGTSYRRLLHICGDQSTMQQQQPELQQDADSMMLRALARHILGRTADVLNTLNQVIAMYPWFLHALADKALLLASQGEWDQALDTAQRLLDADGEHLDALKVIAVHAFTQESQPHDAVQKLEDLDNSLKQREPTNVVENMQVAALFSRICGRQPRALQLCVRLLERCGKNASSDEELAQVLCLQGHIMILQGAMQYEPAMIALREATKRDPNNAQALEGMILCQLCEGAVEDAESQLELLMLMHGGGDSDGADGDNADGSLGYEFTYLQALLLRGKKDAKKEHLNTLMKCRQKFLRQQHSPQQQQSTMAPYMDAFGYLLRCDPDFSMVLSIDFFMHMEPTSSIAQYIPSTSTLLNTGSSSNGFKGQLMQQQQANDGLTIAAVLDDGYGAPLQGGVAAASFGAMNSAAESGLEMSKPVRMGLELIEQVLRICPGMVSAYVEQARCYAALAQFSEAARSLQQCLSLDPNCAPVLVALSSVEAAQFNTQAADRVIEQALACDFSVRSAPRFRLIKSIIRAQQGRLDEAISEIENIMALPEFNFTVSAGGAEAPRERSSTRDAAASAAAAAQISGSGSPYSDAMRLTDDDRVGAFVCYSSLLSKSRRLREANKVLAHAKHVFAGSAQEVQVLVAASQLYVEKSDFDSAIRMLDKISEDSPTFARAQLIKADIVLNHNHDKEGFAKCYQQLADREPNAKNFALLGEAFLRILNPEAAIDALERAYKLEPKNGKLRGRIGRALVATHEYHRAVEFYESAIRELNKIIQQSQAQTMVSSSARDGGTAAGAAAVSSGAGSAHNDLTVLSHDLAKLYIKLGRAESSIRVLNNVLNDAADGTALDLTALRQNVTTLLLLAKVQRSTSPIEVQESLEQAYKAQKEVLLKLRSGAGAALVTGEMVDREKSNLSDICVQLGQCHLGIQEVQSAEQYFQEAVQHNLQNTKAMYGLAKILHDRGDRELCQAQCTKIITAEPGAEEAAILLSEVLFHGDAPESAVEPLHNLLKLHPTNYLALEKAISLLRRAGQLELVPPLLQAAEKFDRRCLSHAGFHYCQGLYAQYTNDIGKAISEFNLARKDEDRWGAPALTHMIALYLNPDQDGAWEEKESGPLDEQTRANIAAAEELLKELRPLSKDKLRVQILENYCLLATRHKASVDKAMQSFVEMLDQDQDYLPAVLGMATGFMIEKNQHKARNLLKRVGKMERSKHDGEDFEKANLLLAKFYIDKAKNDLSQDLCRKTLLENKSCSQAWEILGLVFEKEGNYELASDAYAKAWKLEFEASAPVGYKLAFSYLKCKQYVEAIDICEAVLNLYPDYPRISEEILKKAQENIRSAQ